MLDNYPTSRPAEGHDMTSQHTILIGNVFTFQIRQRLNLACIYWMLAGNLLEPGKIFLFLLRKSLHSQLESSREVPY